jgi:phosphoglycerol geranylgeranyltransferase
MFLLDKLTKALHNGKKMLFVLIDPDHFEEKRFENLLLPASENKIDAFLVGGSLITKGNTEETIRVVKKHTDIPVCIFPGNYMQISPLADAILFMSLISGRNPDFLIGNHVIAAPLLKHTNIEIIPTGYILVDSGRLTTAHYMSNTLPIPANKPEIAACTALAGQMLGLKCIYADAGSGASQPITTDFVKTVCDEIHIPLIAGGGIRTPDTAVSLAEAGATALVVGNAAESDPGLIAEIINALQ